MSKSERPRNRRIKLVGGGFKWTREPGPGSGGSMKAQRRAKRKAEKQRRKGNRGGRPKGAA